MVVRTMEIIWDVKVMRAGMRGGSTASSSEPSIFGDEFEFGLLLPLLPLLPLLLLFVALAPIGPIASGEGVLLLEDMSAGLFNGPNRDPSY